MTARFCQYLRPLPKSASTCLAVLKAVRKAHLALAKQDARPVRVLTNFRLAWPMLDGFS